MTTKQGFRPVSNPEAVTPAWEWLPAEAITPKVGLCLAWDSSSGQLEVSQTPAYICMMEAASAVAAGTLIPVMSVKGWEFEAVLDGDNSNVKPGLKVKPASGGMLVDADGTSSANFTITYAAGTTAGSVVRGKFD